MRLTRPWLKNHNNRGIQGDVRGTGDAVDFKIDDRCLLRGGRLLDRRNIQEKECREILLVLELGLGFEAHLKAR